MKISKDFTGLNRENSLVVVTSTQVAKVYQLKNGKVFKEPTVHVESPRMTDKEGARRREGKGTVWGTASDYEQKDDNVKIEFEHALKKEFKEIFQRESDISAIYLFSPSSTIKTVKEMLPKASQKKVAFEYTGNFIKSAPEDFFKKIKTKRDKEIQKMEKLKPQTEKILARKRTKNSSV